MPAGADRDHRGSLKGDFVMQRTRALMVLLLVLFLGIASAEGAGAQGAAKTGKTSDSSDVDGADYERAPVKLDGEVLFQVRGVPAYPAGERARVISKRIEDIAADRSVAADSLQVAEMEDRSRITVGDRLVVGFIDADGTAEGVSRQLLTERALIRIKEAIAAYRNARSPRALLLGAGYALGAIVLLALLLRVIRGGFRRLEAIADRRFRSRIEALEAKSHQIVQARQLRVALQSLLKGLFLLAVLVPSYLCLQFVLGLFPWTRPLAARLLQIFLDPLGAMVTGFFDSLPGIGFVVILVLVTRYVLKIARLYFESIERGTVALHRFDREWAMPTYKIARMLIVAFAAVVAYPYIPGSNSEAFKGISIFLGVVFSLGSSSVIANAMAGYTMIYRRAFRIGDRISIDNLDGFVTETRLMVTHLRTVKNEEIVVPNSTILNSHVINYSTLAASRGLILHTTVGIGYEAP